ncbi:MAG TPA: hypothetical protein VMT37_13045 [Solirubrobacterales bacterium]|nr:hypothetical protein [Solirubrobacterales bacterium]
MSDDQRAMLRMVAQRGDQGYEDIAALMGLSVEEVRAKVAAALAELDEEGALASATGSDEKKPAEEAPAEKPAPAEAEPVAAKAPPAPTAAPAPKPTVKPARRSSRPPRISMPRGQVLWAAIAGGVIVVALIVIAIVVGDSGGDNESASAASGATTTASAGASGESGSTGGKGSNRAKEVTKAILKPVDGSEAEGLVVFGKVKSSLALEVAAENLQPTSSGEEYSVWLSNSPQKMLPLASVKAPKGRIAAQIELPAEVLGYLADETFTEIALTRTDDATLQAALKKAIKEKQSTPDYTGTEVLRGPVTGPIVGVAQRLEEIEAEKKEKKGE